jgi:cyclomaltodextrinase
MVPGRPESAPHPVVMRVAVLCVGLAAALANATVSAEGRFLSVLPDMSESAWLVEVEGDGPSRMLLDGEPVDATPLDDKGRRFSIRVAGGEGAARSLALEHAGGRAVVRLAPSAIDEAPFNDRIVYHIMLAYFDNASRGNDRSGMRRWVHRNYAGGDLQGVLRRADYLAELGINAVWLSPVFQSETSHGYDVLNYYRIGDAVAVPGDADASRALFDRLVAELGNRDIGVILDLPLDYGAGPYDRRAGDPDRLRPKSTKAKQEAEKVWESWGTGFRYWNFSDEDTRRFLKNVALYWLEQGVAGFRMDYVRGVDHAFWAEVYAEIKAANPQAFVFGEAWIDAESAGPNMNDIATYYEEVEGVGRQFDSLIEYPMQMVMTDVFARGAPVSLLETWLQATAAAYGERGAPIYFLDNHDIARFSDRASGQTRERLLAAITFMASLPGPMSIYYGTETALSGSAPRAGFNDTNRIPMPWEDLDKDLVREVAGIFRMKRQRRVLTHGARLPVMADETGLLMARRKGGETALVAVNLADDGRLFEIPAALPVEGYVALIGDSVPVPAERGRTVWEVPAMSVGIVLAN